MSKRKEANDKYKWDFSYLFSNQQEWKKELDSLDKLVQDLVKLKDQLNQLNNFSQYLELEKQLSLKLVKLNQYLHYADLDLTDLSFQNLSTLYANKCKEISVLLAWIEPELKKIGSKIILAWIKENKSLWNYRYRMEVFFRLDKYVLDAEKEKLLSQVSISRHSISDLYDSLAYADRQPIFLNYQGKEQELTLSLYTKIMEESHPKDEQDFRYQVSKKWNNHFQEKKHSFAKIYEGILQLSKEEIALRGYNSSLEIGLIGDNVSSQVYERLIETGQKNINLYQNFLQIKKEYFGLKKFYGTDNSLKIGKSFQQEFTVEEAVEIVKRSLKILGKEYEEKLKIALQPGRIDYYEDTNKRTGAYSSGGEGVSPIILMNWDNTISSVNTLIHELGHSVHTLFAEENQPYPNASYPIILAEVASTLNEHLLFDYLYQNSQNKEEKIYLLQNRLEEIMGTFFRQIQFAKFEWETHQLIEKNVPLNADVLADLFQKNNEEFGANFFDKKEPKKKNYYWPRISHFFHSPFYVYKYSIAIIVSFQIYQDIKNENVDKFFQFLKAGGHKEPLAILRDIDIDLEKATTYQPLIENINKMLKELKLLLSQ